MIWRIFFFRWLVFFFLIVGWGCGQPLLSIEKAAATRLPDERVRVIVTLKNNGAVPWLGSTQGASDEVCFSASWLSAGETIPQTQASVCYDQALQAKSTKEIALTSTFSVPKTPASEIKIALRVRFPNPGATIQTSIPSP